MTLRDAIKSGRPFRRKGWHLFYQIHPSGEAVNGSGTRIRLWNLEEVLATDWETEDPRSRMKVVK